MVKEWTEPGFRVFDQVFREGGFSRQPPGGFRCWGLGAGGWGLKLPSKRNSQENQIGLLRCSSGSRSPSHQPGSLETQPQAQVGAALLTLRVSVIPGIEVELL